MIRWMGRIETKFLIWFSFFWAINVSLGKSHDEKKRYEEFVEDFHIIIHKKIKIYHMNKSIRSDVGITFDTLKQTNTKNLGNVLWFNEKKKCGSFCTLTDSNCDIDEFWNYKFLHSNWLFIISDSLDNRN